jgi:hypothetical protein
LSAPSILLPRFTFDQKKNHTIVVEKEKRKEKTQQNVINHILKQKHP